MRLVLRSWWFTSRSLTFSWVQISSLKGMLQFFISTFFASNSSFSNSLKLWIFLKLFKHFFSLHFKLSFTLFFSKYCKSLWIVKIILKNEPVSWFLSVFNIWNVRKLKMFWNIKFKFWIKVSCKVKTLNKTVSERTWCFSSSKIRVH